MISYNAMTLPKSGEYVFSWNNKHTYSNAPKHLLHNNTSYSISTKSQLEESHCLTHGFRCIFIEMYLMG